MTAFWIIVSVMIALALVFVVPGLLRGSSTDVSEAALQARRRLQSLEAAHRDGHLSDEDYSQRKSAIAGSLLEAVEPVGQSPGSPLTGVALLIAAPVFAIIMYNHIGNPVAITGAPLMAGNSSGAGNGSGASAMDLDQAINTLKERLENDPDNVDDWFMLGRSYKAVKRFSEAAEAYLQALDLAPNEPVLLVEYAEAAAFANGEPPFPQAAREALEQAMAIDPTLQKGLWLQGLDAFSMGDNAVALERWQALAAQLEPGSEGAQQIAQQISIARQALAEDGGQALATGTGQQPPPTSPQAGDGEAKAELTVQISLAQELSSRVTPGDVLFVFARAHNGPPMPLAIARLTAGQLPTTVTLDSSMAMMPAMNLAAFPQVVVGARISKTGNATAQPGDMEALSGPVPNNQAEPILLEISSIL